MTDKTDALLALCEKWRKEADEIAANNWGCNSNSIRARADELEQALAQTAASVDVEGLRERAERLEAALRPFAALYQPDALCAHSDDQPDSRGVYGINAANITLGDLRRARAALADGEAASA